MSLAKQEFTDAGRSMLGRAQNGESLTITKIVVGSGTKTQASDLWPLTALVHPEMDVVISAKRDYGQGTLLVEGSFKSDQAPHAFQIRELGIMAHIGTEADRLYSVSNVLADPPDNVDPVSPSIHSFKIKLIIDRIPTDSLIVQIGPSENVIGQNLGADTVGPGWYKDAAGNVLNFKRIVQGTGMDIYDQGDSVYVGMKMLKADLDIYVPLTYPGITDPKILFPTIQAAHDYLLQYLIPTNRRATIHVAAGDFHTTVQIYFSHPNSRQIILSGWPRQDKAVTRIEYATATTKNVYCNTSGLAVGQIVYLAGSTVSPWSGGCKILSIQPWGVICSILKKSSRPAYTVPQTSAGMRMSWYPTVMHNDGPLYTSGYLTGYGTVPTFEFPFGIYMVENITVDKGYGGFRFFENGWLQNCQTMGCAGGIAVYATSFGIGKLQSEVVCSDSYVGIGGYGIGAGYPLYINGCSNGLFAQFGKIETADDPYYPLPDYYSFVTHCTSGLSAAGGATLGLGSVWYDYNDTGMYASGQSIVGCSTFRCYPSNNGTDLVAGSMGFIRYAILGGATPTCNPPANTVGNSNSTIELSA